MNGDEARGEPRELEEVDCLIVGAGVSGLATAAALGRQRRLVVLERDDEIGGYCKTVRRDGFVWDYSGHFFHFKRPDIEAWLVARMPNASVRTVRKRTLVSYGGRLVDFPFQKNIHQLPRQDFVDCLVDLYEARAGGGAPVPERNFKEMLSARFGRSIAEKFLIPYNEKLYATELSSLDRDAMGRFFPHAELGDVVRNMRTPDNGSYNATFTYPVGGAIEYVRALASEVAPDAIRASEALVAVDLERRVARTTKRAYRYERLVSSAPLPALLERCGLAPEPGLYDWNQVLVFNLGFDAKGPRDVHWMYFPDRDLPFYRVGFYDNIIDAPRMSLYVELGFPKGAAVDPAAVRRDVLRGLQSEGILTSQRLIAEHAVVMDPAYVHVTRRSNEAAAEARAHLARHGVFSIGRYGGWTYCSIEDNIVEARALVASWG